jgi:hypothetical protein
MSDDEGTRNDMKNKPVPIIVEEVAASGISTKQNKTQISN